ncbi:MAG: TrbC/VirB2 family protein [Proteobacteria bacterium]|nr:TrbC/VirB2 family protein [Pseudomonadota bacterium]
MRDHLRRTRAGMMCGLPLMFVAGAASAQTLTNGINNIISLLSGNFVLAVATLAIMIVGFLWMSGRLEIMRALTIVIGIGVVGAAASIATSLVGSS